jgi:ribosomal protein L11 methyltransferase
MLKLSKISLIVPYEAKDLLSDFLIGQNAEAVSEDLDNSDNVLLSALFSIELDLDPIMENLYDFIGFIKDNFVDFEPGRIKVEHIDKSSWEIWKSVLKTVRAGENVIITPPWEKYKCLENEKLIIINPSMAFGTGHHETTKVCISYIEKMVKNEGINSLLDVGCGSAILSIAAIKLGIKQAVAFDIDPIAIKEANENKSRNSVGDTIRTYCGPIQCVKGIYDIVVANISVEAILMMKSELKSRLNKNGRLILSGIPVMRMEELERGIVDAGFDIIDRQIDGEWVGMFLKHS